MSHEDYRPPASAVAVDGATWRLGIDGRPYYVTAQKASGRMTAKRHQVFFGVRQRAVLNWGASDGALSHENILAKMRGWSLKHPGDPRLKRDDADADEKPDENSGAHCVFSWLIKIYNKNLSSVAQVNHVTRNRVRRPARNRVRRIMKQGIQMRWSLMLRRMLVQCACGSDPGQFTPSRRADLRQLGIVARTVLTAMTTIPRSPKVAVVRRQ